MWVGGFGRGDSRGLAASAERMAEVEVYEPAAVASKRPMTCRSAVFASVLFLLVVSLGIAQLPAPKPADPNPWNGTWRLDVKRSSPAAAGEGVPQAYRLTLGPGDGSVVSITWEIPELGEVVKGVTDGSPMPIHRKTPTPGMALGVRRDGRSALVYTVYKDGKVVGGGRMMLVDEGAAWVDLTWPEARQDLASELVYAK